MLKGDQEEMCIWGMCNEYLSVSGSCPIEDIGSNSSEHLSYII